MADEARTREELVAEVAELRRRISILEAESLSQLTSSSLVAPAITSAAMPLVEPDDLGSTVGVGGPFTQTIDLSGILTETDSVSGTFVLGSRLWATTFGKIVQALPLSAFLIDETHRITALNKACSRINSDYSRLEGAPFADLFNSTHVKERAESLVKEIFSDRRPRSWEAVFQGANQLIWARLNFRPVRITKQRFLLVIMEDLTQEKILLQRNTIRKKELEEAVSGRTAELAETNERLREEISNRVEAEMALRKSEERFRQMAELLPEHVFEVDSRGFFTFSNRIGSEELGYKREEMEGRLHMLQVLSSEDHSRALEEFRRLKSGEKVSGTDYSLLRKDGSTFEVSSYTAPIVRDGKVEGARGVAVNISELKNAQRELAQLNRDLELRVQQRTAELVLANETLKEEIIQREAVHHELEMEKGKLAGILEAMEDGVYMVDEGGNIQFINRALVKDFGPVEGKKCYQYFHDRSEPCSECHMGRVLHGNPAQFEWFSPKNGKTYELRAGALRNSDGSIWQLEILRNITKQKRAEQSLRDSEKRYRELVENATDIAFETDASGSIKFMNAACEKITGFSSEEFLGKHYLDSIPPEYKKRVERFYDIQFVKKLPDSYYEYPIIGKDGKELWLGQRVHLVTRDEKVVGFQAICRDITKRHEVEEKLRKSEERFRELSELLPQFIFEADEDLKFTFLNRIGVLESGYAKDEVFGGLSVWEMVVPDDQHKVSENLLKISQGKTSLGEEYTLKRKDGSTFPVIAYASPIMRDGHFHGVRGVAVDITDLKRSESALKESEEKYRHLVERANDGIAIVQDAQVKYANPAMATMLGYDYLEELDQPFTKYVHPSVRAELQVIYLKRMAGEQVPSVYDTVMLSKSGDEILVEVNSGNIEFSGKPATLLIIRDVGERRKIETLLEESELKFRSVVENATEGITVIRDGEVIYANPCALEIMGFPKNTARFGPFLDFIHPEDRESAANRYRKRLEGESFPNSFLLRILNKQGLTKWIEADSFVMDWEGATSLLTFWKDVTERRSADESIKESEARFRSLFENMINGVAVYKPAHDGDDFFFSDMNRAGEIMDHLDRKDIIGRSVLEVFPGIKDFGLFDVFKKVWQMGQTEHHAVAKYKDERIEGWRDNVVYKLPTGDIVAVYSDESERKKAEDARNEIENRYRAIVDNAQDSIFLKDLQLKYTHVNPAMERLFELPNSALIGKTDHELFAERTAEAIQRVDERVLGGQPAHYEDTKAVNGVTITFDVVKAPIRDSSGKVVGICGIARDVTEKRRADLQIRQSERKYRALFNNSRDAIYITARDGRIEEGNPAFEKMFGFEGGEHRGLSVVDLYNDPTDRERFRKEIERQGSVRDFEVAFKRKDGLRLDCLLTSSVRRDSDGKIVGYEGSIRDVTDRKVLERQLFQAQKMEAVGQLAGGIAHDFNNILYAIMGYAELALDEAVDNRVLAKFLSQVLKAAERAKFLVNQILAFSRQSEVEKRPVLIGPIVEEVCKFLRASLPSTIEIRWKLRDRLSPILADPTQIHQVLMNLCTNAGHAMRETGGKLGISVEERDLDAALLVSHPDSLPGLHQEITVSDTGHGMHRPILDRIFDPYFTTKEKGEGTGLGLSVVHGIVNALGGVIKVESTPGAGTVFRVYLPVVQESIPEVAPSLEALKTGHERVLVVDDEQPVTEMISMMLGRLGYEVVTRTSSVEALALFREKPKKFDVVITDMTMPNMTGKELAQRIREIRGDIPIILCTGFSELMNERLAKTMGIQAFIMKPILREEMAKVIRRVLDTEESETI